MTAKNIVFLTKRFYTNKDVINDRFGRNYYLPTGLSRLGNSVTVLVWDYKTPHDDRRRMDGVDFINISCRRLGVFSFFLKTIFHIWRIKPGYIVGSGDTYFGFFAFVFARLFRAKSIFDVYDFYPAFGTNRILGMKSLFYKMLGSVDGVYCASKPLQTLIQRYRNSALFIPNAIDEKTFIPLDKRLMQVELGLDTNLKYIGYFGSLATERGTFDLLEAFQLLLAENPSIGLLLAGKFEENINVDLPGVKYVGFLTQQEIVKYIAACDVVTLPYHENDLIQYGNSCKTMEYIACHRPLVASRVNNILENYPRLNEIDEQRFFSIPADVEDLARALKWQLVSQYVLPLDWVLKWEDLAVQLDDLLN